MAKLFKGDFKGELSVLIEIELSAYVSANVAKYAYKKEKQGPQSLFGGMVSTDDDRPSNIKNIICKHDPFVLVVEVDPRNKEPPPGAVFRL